MERDREGEIEGERDIKEEFLGDARDSEQDRKLYFKKKEMYFRVSALGMDNPSTA